MIMLLYNLTCVDKVQQMIVLTRVKELAVTSFVALYFACHVPRLNNEKSVANKLNNTSCQTL